MTSADFTAQAVENLVTQFSSALDFYRELVQNSIDAGSSEIEIWLDFIPSEDGGTEGVIEIHVDDFGEGMNEAIIDGQLTTLFSSSKENDLTKIGKFGIGFVSVFALGPRGVLVQTGRDGECWEVFFDHDRSFFKAPLEAMVEGTQITLFLEGDRARYRELVAASRETIDHWCRHSEAEIGFEDRASIDGEREVINRPFVVDGACMTRVGYDGTEIVLAYSRAPVWGFYNKGLALAVGKGKTDLVPAGLADVAFRIKSRYLEHTLARETVMRDENYERAMRLLREAAAGQLRRALFDELTALVAIVTGRSGAGDGAGDGEREAVPGRPWTATERGRYFERMAYLAAQGKPALDELDGAMDQPILLTLDGRALTLATLLEHADRDGRVYLDHQVSTLAERLRDQGTPVVLVASPDEVAHFGSDPLGLDPVARVLAHALAGSFVTTTLIQRLLDKVRDEPREGTWMDAVNMLARPEEVLVHVEVLAAEVEPGAQALVGAAERILVDSLGTGATNLRRALDLVRGRASTIGYRRMVCARIDVPAGAESPLFVVARTIAPVMATPSPELMAAVLVQRPEAAVNCEHPHFRALLAFAGVEPAMAAYCLAKSLLLHTDYGLELDADLMGTALALAEGVAG